MPEQTPQTERRKVSPLAIAILSDIQNGIKDPKELTIEKRRLCVRHMMHTGGVTNYEMAELLKISVRSILEDKKYIRSENSLSVLVIDESEIAMEMLEVADLCMQKLLAQKKYRDAWSVRDECIARLQTMGYVKKVEQKLNIKGQISLLEILDLASASDPQSDDNGSNGNGNGHRRLETASGRELEEASN